MASPRVAGPVAVVHAEVLPLLGVSVLLGSLALLAVGANPRGAPNLGFGAFLGLVAGNFACGWLAGVTLPGRAFDGRWFAVADALLVLDAAALLYFTSIFPRRSAVASRTWATAALLAGVAALEAAMLADPGTTVHPANRLVQAAVIAFVVGSYLAALVIAVRNVVAVALPTVRQDARALAVGMVVAVAPRVGLVGLDLGWFLPAFGGAAAGFQVAVTWAVFAAAALALRRAEAPGEWPKTRRLLALAGAFVAAVSAVWVVAAASGGADAYLSLVYSGRWVFFALLMARAFLRQTFLEVDWRWRGPARLATPVFAGLVLFLGLHAVLPPFSPHDAGPWTSTDSIAAAGGILLAVGLLAVPAVPPGPSPASLEGELRKREAYRGLVEAAVESGRGSDDPRLEAHRRRLGLSLAEHRDLTALVEADHALRSLRGPEGALPEGFRLVRAFQPGANAWTVLAEQEGGGEPVVVKVLRPELRGDERARAAFLREMRLLARVQHPNVVRLLQVIEEPPAIVMEHASGGSLAERVARGGPLPVEVLERLARNLLGGLAALHGVGIVHRDVKPENVLFRAGGTALLADVGVAREMAGGTKPRLTAPGAEPGTVLYMAPEQVRGQACDERTDLYALGAVLVFAATGRHYLEAEGLGEYDAKRIILEAEPRLPALPGGLKRLAAGCLRKRPDERPRDALAAARLLDVGGRRPA